MGDCYISSSVEDFHTFRVDSASASGSSSTQYVGNNKENKGKSSSAPKTPRDVKKKRQPNERRRSKSLLSVRQFKDTAAATEVNEKNKKDNNKFTNFFGRFKGKNKTNENMVSKCSSPEPDQDSSSVKKQSPKLHLTPTHATGWFLDEVSEKPSLTKGSKSARNSAQQFSRESTIVRDFDASDSSSERRKDKKGKSHSTKGKSGLDHCAKNNESHTTECKDYLQSISMEEGKSRRVNALKKWFKRGNKEKTTQDDAMETFDDQEQDNEVEYFQSPQNSPFAHRRLFILGQDDDDAVSESLASARKQKNAFQKASSTESKKARGQYKTKVITLEAVSDDDDQDGNISHQKKDPNIIKRITYDNKIHEDNVEDLHNALPISWLVNLLADNSRRAHICLVDARSYDQFQSHHIAHAQHISQFKDEDLQFMTEGFSDGKFVILYSDHSRGGGQRDNDYHNCRAFLSSQVDPPVVPYLLEVGFSIVAEQCAFVCCRDTAPPAAFPIPHCFDNASFYLLKSNERNLRPLLEQGGFSHVISVNSDVPYRVSSVVHYKNVSVEEEEAHDEHALYNAFVIVWDFLRAKCRHHQHANQQRVLIVALETETLADAFLVGGLMRRKHWSLSDAYRHARLRCSTLEITKWNVNFLKLLEKKLFGKQFTSNLPKLHKLPFQQPSDVSN